MPANAPIGVRNAPMFDPAIEAKMAGAKFDADEFKITEVNITDIGMLFKTFAATKEE